MSPTSNEIFEPAADPDYSVLKMLTFPAAGDEDANGLPDSDWDQDGQADQSAFVLTMPRVTLRVGAVVGNPANPNPGWATPQAVSSPAQSPIGSAGSGRCS